MTVGEGGQGGRVKVPLSELELVECVAGDDVDDVVGLVNECYKDLFFKKEGADRIKLDELVAEVAAPGVRIFRILRRSGSRSTTVTGAGGEPAQLVGCVKYVEVSSERCYLGMLAVHPRYGGSGVGSWATETLERRAREEGRRIMEILVVEVQNDLLAYWGRRGFQRVGKVKWDHGGSESVLHPDYASIGFLKMEKPLYY